MSKLFVISLLFGVMFFADAHATYQVTKEDRKQWFPEANSVALIGGGVLPIGASCKGSVADIGVDIVKNKDTSKSEWAELLAEQLDAENNSKGAAYYIAYDFTANGYKFCKTYVAADRNPSTGYPQIEYWYSKSLDETPDCFWLCKPGFYSDGMGCKSTTMTDTSIPDLSKMFTYSGAQSLTETGFRDKQLIGKIPKLFGNLEVQCGSSEFFINAMQIHAEHVVLAISEMSVDTGANSVAYTVQPMAIRAVGFNNYTNVAGSHAINASSTAWPLVSFPDKGVKDNTMCPGNMVHKDGGGCYMSPEMPEYQAAQAKASALEEQGLSILCSGWPREKYDNKVHVLNSDSFMYQNWRTVGDTSNNLTKEEYIKSKCPGMDSTCVSNVGNSYDSIYGNASATCTVFVCKGEGMGYKSDPVFSKDFTCVSCSQNADDTIHHLRLGVGVDGMCKVCDVGEILSDGKCIVAKSIHKYYMDGIKDKDATDPRSLTSQCWTKRTPEDYITCMEGTGWVGKKE